MKTLTTLKMLAGIVALSGVSAYAQMSEGPWMLRLSAVNINSSNQDGTGYGLTVNNRTVLAADVSYFFTRHVALELMMMAPQEHTLYANGVRLGTLEQAPPALLLQYHFEAPGFRPYVGVGLNYAQYSAVRVPGFELDKSSVGAALQVGVGIPVARNLYLNLDLKKLYMGTDVYQANGVNLGAFKIDPVLFGVGLGLRF